MKEDGENRSCQKHSDYDHVLKYTGLFGGVQGITMFMSLVRNKIAATLLGPNGVALITVFNNILKLVYESTNFGVPFSAVKHMAEIHSNESKEERNHYASVVRTWCIFSGLLGTLIIMALSHYISYWTFNNYDYELCFLLLSPSILCLTVSGGEIAILKGTKELKKVALSSVLASVSALCLCIPIYYLLGATGVALSLLLTNAAVMLIQTYFANKVIPWKISLFDKNSYIQGIPMLKLGTGYIIAGIFGQGAEYVIRWAIIHIGNLSDVGLYYTGYAMAVAYTSMVFIAIEADYFPRLSAAKSDLAEQNSTINQQVEVCALLIAPILVLFVTFMPVIVVTLYSPEFLDSVPMAVLASFYMFFKALTLPVAYLSLAHGDSKIYMGTELVYDIFIAIVIPIAYSIGGLDATGIALSIAGLMDLIMIHSIYRIKYHYRFSTRLLHFYILQFILLGLAVFFSFQGNILIRYGADITVFIISATMSLRILSRESDIIRKFIGRFKKQ